MKMLDTVLQIMDFAAPYPGSFVRSFLALDDALAKKGVKSVYLFPSKAKELYWIKELNKNKTIYFYVKGSLINNIYLLHKIVLNEKVKLIHANFTPNKYKLLLCFYRALNRKIALVFHYRNHWSVRSKINDFILKKCFHICDANIGCSDDVVNELMKKGFSKERCYSVQNAIDFSRFDIYEPQKNNFEKNCSVFLMFGYDFYGKGVDIAVKAIYNLANQYNILLALVFSSNQEKGIREIKNILGEFPSWIKILPPTDDIGSYYNIVDCFISASRQEGFCNSIVEAAYCNCQSIISNIPGHRTDIPEIKIFETENVSELEGKIIEVICESPEKRKKINELQKEYIINAYMLDSWTKAIINIYENVTQK